MIAVISDIHSNIFALDAVLADIQRRGISTIVNLGDHLYGAIDPLQTAERIISSGMICISGNQDRHIHSPSGERRTTSTYQFIVKELAASHIEWLKALPQTYSAEGIFFCHATPESDETYLLEEVTPHGVQFRSHEALATMTNQVAESVICCGHSHVPHAVQVPNGKLIVNVGSVGIPAYTDDEPYPHAMESGSSHARYAILEQTEFGWQVDHIAVPYDWQSAATIATANGRPDTALWVSRGRV
jgi:predicted phosphodiesterase